MSEGSIASLLDAFARLWLELAISQLWIGALLAVVVALVLATGRRATAGSRYRVIALAFTTVVVLPLAIVGLRAASTLVSSARRASVEPAPARASGAPLSAASPERSSLGTRSPITRESRDRATEGEERQESRAEPREPIPRVHVGPSASAGRAAASDDVPTLEPPGAAAPLLLPPGRWLSVLLLVWLSGVLLHLLRLALGLRALVRLRRRSLPLPADVDHVITDALRESRLRRPVTVRASDDVATPITVGYRSALILLPRRLTSVLGAEGLRHVVLHELAHVRRRDDWMTLAQRVGQSLTFHHPGARWLGSALDAERELACDEAVVDRVGEPRRYARSLVRLAELSAGASALALAPGMSTSTHGLAARVQRLTAATGARRSRGAPLTAAGLFTLALGATAIAAARPVLSVRAEAESPRAVGSGSAHHPIVRSNRGFARGPLGARLDSILNRYEAYGFSGVLLVAIRGEVVLRKGYGLADRERHIPMTAETPFSSAGMTKALTAAAVLKLEEEGRLRTTDLVSRYLGAFPGAKSTVTIHHLLTHTDGLAATGAPVFREDRDSFVAAMKATPMAFAPGERSRYTDFGHSLLGVVLERITGEPYEEYVSRHFLQAAGMTATRFESDVRTGGSRLAVEYSGPMHDQRPIGARRYWWGRRASLGMVSTVDDLYRLHLALVGNRIVSARVRERMFQTQVDRNEYGTSQGYGWEIIRNRSGTTIHRRIAGTPGFEGELLHGVDEDWVAVIAVNSRLGWRFPIWREIARAARGAPAGDLPTAPDTAASTRAALGALEGRYSLPSGGALRIERRGSEVGAWLTGRAALDMIGAPRESTSVSLSVRRVGGGEAAAVYIPRLTALRLVAGSPAEPPGSITVITPRGRSRVQRLNLN